ncbi:hypothetical protein EYF80_028679 [Liparis tanakae]|uniref:Uncharacterized protein n=1 Tax=Liparis tanakae TaxID=230148 RepID=A0A4Z2H684_9TELE|nr:hypothetical protein EYF80_028679 [Liparis tanakae]
MALCSSIRFCSRSCAAAAAAAAYEVKVEPSGYLKANGLRLQAGGGVHGELVRPRRLAFDAPGRRVVAAGATTAAAAGLQRVGGLGLDPQQLAGVALLHVPRQVVLPAEALGAVLAQEVLASRVHHHVAPHVLAGVEAALAVLAAVLLLLGAAGGLAGVRLQVLQEDAGAGERLQAHLAGSYRSSLYLETKALVQSGWEQRYGLSPECEYECTFSFSRLLNAFWHSWHGKFFLGFPSALRRLPADAASLDVVALALGSCGHGTLRTTRYMDWGVLPDRY